MRLRLDADIAADMDLFGKVAGDLQEDIEVGEASITGTLKYVTGYTGFSGKAEEQSGNYIVVHADVPGMDDVTYTVKVTKAVTLDSDQTVVLRIRNKDTQTITVTASKEGFDTVTKVYTLSGLTCETAA